MTESTLHLWAACTSPTLRGLRQVKEYVAGNKLRRRAGTGRLPLIECEPVDSLDQAIANASTAPAASIILACGFPTTHIRHALADQADPPDLTIISSPPAGTARFHVPTASLFEARTITRVRKLVDGVRKAVLRFAARQLGDLREIKEPGEFERYFALRFRVWKDLGYLAPERNLDNDVWEIDHFDRFAIPIGLFSANNELVACARLVQQFGREKTKHVRTISRLLKRRGSEAAALAFSYPGTAEQPFDILCEFRGFRDYFRSLVRNQSSVAEVSRIIVAPEVRGCGVAEVLVDSLGTLAKLQRVDILMLACREALSPLYQHCGFSPVPNLISEKFISIPEKSIVMERVLKRE